MNEGRNITLVQGWLEVDHDRGVIYFHLSSKEDITKLQAITLLRIQGISRPIPEKGLIDIKVEKGK